MGECGLVREHLMNSSCYFNWLFKSPSSEFINAKITLKLLWTDKAEKEVVRTGAELIVRDIVSVICCHRIGDLVFVSRSSDLEKERDGSKKKKEERKRKGRELLWKFRTMRWRFNLKQGKYERRCLEELMRLTSSPWFFFWPRRGKFSQCVLT